jgi:hypothetical protein
MTTTLFTKVESPPEISFYAIRVIKKELLLSALLRA